MSISEVSQLQAAGHGEPLSRPTGAFTYSAFISYRHKEPDRAWARRVAAFIEGYKVPQSLVQKGYPRKLPRTFLDENELRAASDLDDELKEALSESAHLVVICSPATPDSRWVGEEIEYFQGLGREDRVSAVLVLGEPEESFPAALRRRRRIADELTDGTVAEREILVEPLAADLRRGKLREEGLRVVAALLDCDFEDLRRRDQQRRRKTQMMAGAIVAVIVAAFVLMVLSYNRSLSHALSQTNRELYFNQIRLADSLIREHEYGLAEQALWKAPEDLRRWEWGHLLASSRPELMSTSSLVCPNFRRALQPLGDGRVGVWDIAGGRLLGALDLGWSVHRDSSQEAHFSADGRKVLLKKDELVHLWDLDSGTTSLLTNKAWLGVELSETGERALVSLDGEGDQVFETATKRPLLPSGAGGICRLSADGSTLLSEGHSNFSVYRLDGGTSCSSIEEPMNGNATANASRNFLISPDGRMVVGVRHMSGRKVWIWETKQCTLLKELETGGDVNDIAFDRTTSRVAIASSDFRVRIWDAERAASPPGEIACPSPPTSVAFNPDGRRLAAGCQNGDIYVWDLVTGGRIALFSGHSTPLQSTRFTPDGEALLTRALEGGILQDSMVTKLWPLPTRPTLAQEMESTEPLRRFASAPDGLSCVSYLVDPEFAYTQGAEEMTTDSSCLRVRIWDPLTGELVCESETLSAPLSSLTLAPGRRRGLIVWRQKQYALLDLEQGRVLASNPLCAVLSQDAGFPEFSPDGEWAALTESVSAQLPTTGSVQMTRIYRMSDGVEVAGPVKGSGRGFLGPNLLAVADERKTVLVRGSDGSPMSGPLPVTWTMAMSPDGQTLAFTDRKSDALRLFDAPDWKPSRVRHVPDRMPDLGLGDIVFSPKSMKMVAIAEPSGIPVLWNTTSANDGVTTLAPRLAGVYAYGVAFAPDGERLAVASQDGRVILYSAVDGRELLALELYERGRGVFLGNGLNSGGSVAPGSFSVGFSGDGIRLAAHVEMEFAEFRPRQWQAEPYRLEQLPSGGAGEDWKTRYEAQRLDRYRRWARTGRF